MLYPTVHKFFILIILIAVLIRVRRLLWNPTKNRLFFESGAYSSNLGILNLFLKIEGVTRPESQRIIFKSLLMSCFVMKQIKSGAE